MSKTKDLIYQDREEKNKTLASEYGFDDFMNKKDRMNKQDHGTRKGTKIGLVALALLVVYSLTVFSQNLCLINNPLHLCL